MSLARALTTRRKAKEEAPAPPMPYIGRAASQRAPNAKPIRPSDISLPVALISTTNMLSYEAPDITDAPHAKRMGTVRQVSSTISERSSAPSTSGDDSGSTHSRETDATSLDLSSPELSQDAYHKEGYFKSPMSPPQQSLNLVSPRIPTRAASHSKKAHVMSHKASIKRAATTASRPSVRDRVNAFNAQTEPMPVEPHPFGRELEQLDEAAEEFGQAVQSASRSAEAEIDRSVMQAKGLLRFCANEYMDEIASLHSTAFEEDHANYPAMVWI